MKNISTGERSYSLHISDTMRDNNDIAPFKNILNEMYSKRLPIERSVRKSSNSGVASLFARLSFKKRSRADIVRLVATGDLVPAQLVQIKSAIEKGLTESQLVELMKNRPVVVIVQEGYDADSCHALTSIAKVRYHYSILLRWKQTKPRNPLDKRRESAYNGVGIYDCTLSSHFSSVTSSSNPRPGRTSSCTSSGKSLSGTPSSRTSASASP